MQPRDDLPPSQPRPWGRVSTIRLETFSDSVFAIAVTLLALQLHPPNLDGATTAGAVLHALAQQRRQFGFYALAFLVTDIDAPAVNAISVRRSTCSWPP